MGLSVVPVSDSGGEIALGITPSPTYKPNQDVVFSVGSDSPGSAHAGRAERGRREAGWRSGREAGHLLPPLLLGVEQELYREGHRVPPARFLPQQLSHPWGAEPRGMAVAVPTTETGAAPARSDSRGGGGRGVLRDELVLGERRRQEEGPLPIAGGRRDRPPTHQPHRSAPPPAPCAPPADGGARCGAGGGAASGGGAARSPRAAAGLSGPREERGQPPARPEPQPDLRGQQAARR